MAAARASGLPCGLFTLHAQIAHQGQQLLLATRCTAPPLSHPDSQNFNNRQPLTALSGSPTHPRCRLVLPTARVP